MHALFDFSFMTSNEFFFTGAIPEFFSVVTVVIEEGSEEVCNGSGFTLTGMMRGVESTFADDRESVMTVIRSTSRKVASGIPNRMATNSAFGYPWTRLWRR